MQRLIGEFSFSVYALNNYVADVNNKPFKVFNYVKSRRRKIKKKQSLSFVFLKKKSTTPYIVHSPSKTTTTKIS